MKKPLARPVAHSRGRLARDGKIIVKGANGVNPIPAWGSPGKCRIREECQRHNSTSAVSSNHYIQPYQPLVRS